MHVVWYTALSLDGRIAGPGDDLSFLDSISNQGEPHTEFEDFLATVDAALVGGSTLRWLQGNGHELPTRGRAVWVLSRDPATRARAEAAADATTPVHCTSGDVAAVLESIEAAGHARVWLCGGGDVAGQLLAADLVDELVLTMAPVALGAGPALFEHCTLPTRRFTLDELRSYGTNSVRMRWMRTR